MSHFKSIIGQSPALESLIRSAKMVAATDVTVLLQGETGTGKEIFANAIQKASSRADQAFITLNCAALPESLIESELFGHKKGSFTGATASTQGLFKAADGGTLFLDEINSLPYTIQAKLLRFLECGECLAIGETKTYQVDVRIIAATNTDLSHLVAKQEFRSDLYYRLNVVPLELPSLRHRSNDIEALINHFMTIMATTYAMETSTISKQALKALKAYSWPGNIRELRNICERLSILMAGKTIELENLPEEFLGPALQKLDLLVLPESGIALDSVEANLIHQALNRTKGNRSKTAKLLGLTRDTLIYRMQKHGFH